MDSQLNSPREMFCRFMYVMHVLGFLMGALTGVGALASFNLRGGISCSLALATAFWMRHLGKRWFRFVELEKLLTTSHPYAGQRLGKDIERLMELFEQLENETMEAMERHKLRRQISDILRTDERLVSYYYGRLTRLHPYLLRSL